MLFRKVVAPTAACWATAASAAPDQFERAVLAAINEARTHPREVATELRRYRAAFAGRVVREGDDPIGVMTFEGVRAVDEAIDFLERQPPLPPLDAGAVLARAAQGLAAAQGPAGGWGHAAGAGSAGARARAAGGDIYVGETISYGMTTPATVVRQLIVDDGQPQRGHRTLVFAPGFRFAGVGCGGHARFGSMCVIDYAGTPDGAPVMPQVAAAEPAPVRLARR